MVGRQSEIIVEFYFKGEPKWRTVTMGACFFVCLLYNRFNR